MAREVQRGANAVQGVEATLWQVKSLWMRTHDYHKNNGKLKEEGAFYYFGTELSVV